MHNCKEDDFHIGHADAIDSIRCGVCGMPADKKTAKQKSKAHIKAMKANNLQKKSTSRGRNQNEKQFKKIPYKP